jgi:hypothetical protein
MSISGCPFKYDGIMSTQYGLIIVNIDTDSQKIKIDGKKTYTTINLPSNNKFYMMGRQVKEPLSFDVEIAKKDGTTLTDLQQRNVIKWLFDRGYHKFEIMDKEYAGLYFNCYFTDTEALNYGVGCIGYKFTVTCDAAWAWETPKTYTYSFTTLPSTINFISNSDYEDYLFPQSVAITCGTTGGTISITNKDDNNHLVQFTGLSANEVITLDDLGQISSSTGNSRINNWNGHRFKFRNKDNHLYVNGDVKTIQITYQNVRRISY